MSPPTAVPRQPQRKHPVSAEVFASIDMRVGVVQDVEAFPEARKPAWKLRVDFGPGIGVLQTSAQITNYAADALLGRRVVGVINLGTRRIAQGGGAQVAPAVGFQGGLQGGKLGGGGFGHVGLSSGW